MGSTGALSGAVLDAAASDDPGGSAGKGCCCAKATDVAKGATRKVHASLRTSGLLPEPNAGAHRLAWATGHAPGTPAEEGTKRSEDCSPAGPSIGSSMTGAGKKGVTLGEPEIRALHPSSPYSAGARLVVEGGNLVGLYLGSPEAAWSAAADLSQEVHILQGGRESNRDLTSSDRSEETAGTYWCVPDGIEDRSSRSSALHFVPVVPLWRRAVTQTRAEGPLCGVRSKVLGGRRGVSEMQWASSRRRSIFLLGTGALALGAGLAACGGSSSSGATPGGPNNDATTGGNGNADASDAP